MRKSPAQQLRLHGESDAARVDREQAEARELLQRSRIELRRRQSYLTVLEYLETQDLPFVEGLADFAREGDLSAKVDFVSALCDQLLHEMEQAKSERSEEEPPASLPRIARPDAPA